MSIKTRVLVALWIMLLVNYLERVAISFAAPSIMASLSMTPATFGIVLSSFGVGYMLALIPGGLAADRWGVKPIFVIAPLFWALFTGLHGLAATFAAFVIVRICFGISEGVAAPSVYKAIGEHFDSKQRAGAVALVLSAVMLGPAVAGPLAGVLLAAYSWQIMFAVLIVPAVLVSVASLMLLPGRVLSAPARAADDAQGKGSVSFRGVLRRPSLWLVSASNFATDIAQYGFMAWMPTYLAMERHLDIKSVGLYGSLPYLSGVAGLLLGGLLGSTILQHLRPQMVACMYLAAGLSLFLAYGAESLVMALVGLSCAGFFMYGAVPSKGAIVIELAPEEHRGGFVAVNNTAGQIGGAAAPAVIGFLVTATGTFASGFALMAISLCGAAACMVALMPHLTRRVSEVAASPGSSQPA